MPSKKLEVIPGRMSKQPPNPGSTLALKKGCLCPVLDNNHGSGSSWGPGKWWVNADCPLHGKKTGKYERDESY